MTVLAGLLPGMPAAPPVSAQPHPHRAQLWPARAGAIGHRGGGRLAFEGSHALSLDAKGGMVYGQRMIRLRCRDCGVVYAASSDHICLVRPAVARSGLVPAAETVTQRIASGEKAAGASTTYKYRDPERRRAYLREYMRGWRAKRSRERAAKEVED
jgi:hypothetical protein